MSFPFTLVLHTHLPMVVNHGRWPHGSDWLNEATFECYLPLLEIAHRLVADGHLAEVDDQSLARARRAARLPGLPEGAGVLLRERPARVRGDAAQHFEREGSRTAIVALTDFWEDFYERMWELHRRIGGDIPGTFAELQRAGHLRSSPARPPTATCRCCRATSPSTCSCAPPWRRTGVTSAGRRAGSGCRSAPTARATNGRRPPGPTAAATGAAAPRHRGDAGRARPRVLRGRRAPGGGRRAASSSIATTSPCRGSRCATEPAPLSGEREAVAVPHLPGRLARRHRLGRGLLPRSAHDAAGVEPRARLPGRVRVSWSSTRSTTRAGFKLLAHHRRGDDLGTKAGLRSRRSPPQKVGLQATPLRRAGAGHR